LLLICTLLELIHLINKLEGPLVLSRVISSVTLPACGNTILYVFEGIVAVTEPETVSPKGKSIAGLPDGGVAVGVGVGVGGGVGLISLSLSPGLGAVAVGCCIGSGVAVGVVVAVTGGLVCGLLFPLKTSPIGPKAVKRAVINRIIAVISPIIFVVSLIFFTETFFFSGGDTVNTNILLNI
jgi:hypothetical protein